MNATENLPPRVSPGRIQPDQLAALLRNGNQALLLDVRSPAEYDAQHVAGTHLQPLDSLDPAEWARRSAEGPLYVFCQSGGRASRAANLLAAQGVTCSVVDGGVEAWSAAGLPVEKAASKVLPLMRQVQLVIGLVSGTGAALAVWKHPLFALIPLFTSAGLVFAGATGYCGLAMLMARMPWNRRRNTDGKNSQYAPATASCCATPGDNQ
jgi:rhodanese-related sulfurtransferase